MSNPDLEEFAQDAIIASRSRNLPPTWVELFRDPDALSHVTRLIAQGFDALAEDTRLFPGDTGRERQHPRRMEVVNRLLTLAAAVFGGPARFSPRTMLGGLGQVAFMLRETRSAQGRTITRG